jgi:hypothetical protein
MYPEIQWNEIRERPAAWKSVNTLTMWTNGQGKTKQQYSLNKQKEFQICADSSWFSQCYAEQRPKCLVYRTQWQSPERQIAVGSP